MKTIVYLFQCVPRIYYLKLKAESSRQPELVNPIFWETCLSKYLVKLKRLYLNVDTYEHGNSINPIWNSLEDKEKIIEQIDESNYWSSHQWKATFDRSIPTPPSIIYWADFQVV